MKLKILLVLLLVPVVTFAETVFVENVVGECTLINITPEQARLCAIEQAKRTALERAGVEQVMSVTTTLKTEENNDNFSDAFNSFSSMEMRGGIVGCEVLEGTIAKHLGVDVYKVTINAKVKKYKNALDPQFQIYVTGLQSAYRGGEVIQFDVTPTQKGFLKLFMFENEQNASVIYPNAYEPSLSLEGGKMVSFPTTSILEYVAEKKTKATSEHNYFIFVYTKIDIPFLLQPTYENILSWIYAIDPDQRTVQFHDLTIY